MIGVQGKIGEKGTTAESLMIQIIERKKGEAAKSGGPERRGGSKIKSEDNVQISACLKDSVVEFNEPRKAFS